MVSLTREQNVTILQLDASYASLDDKALQELGEVLLSEASFAEPPHLLLDMSPTQFIGSRFIELLVRAWKRIRIRDGAMVLCGVQQLCDDVLRVSRLDTLWSEYPTRSEALAAIAGLEARPEIPSGQRDQADGRR